MIFIGLLAAKTMADGTPNYAVAFASDFYYDTVAGFTRMMTVGAMLSSPVAAEFCRR